MSELKEETRHWVLSILFFVLAIFFVLASFDKAGFVGRGLFGWFDGLFGVGYVTLPLLFLLLGVSFFKNIKPHFAIPRTAGAVLFLLSGLGAIDLLAGQGSGGIVGRVVSKPLTLLFDFWISLIFLVAVFFISLAIIFDTKPTFKSFSFWKNKEGEDSPADREEEFEEEEEEEEDNGTVPATEKTEEEKEESPADEGKKKGGIGKMKEALRVSAVWRREGKGEKAGNISIDDVDEEYSTPPLSLLGEDRGKPSVGNIKANANIIKRTLQNFGIQVEMDEVSIGPSVTRYALKPAEGVKLSRIVGLQNDLSLALAAHPIRIEAPIPGKSLVGIELPNSTKTTVGLGTLLASEEYRKSLKPLVFALGKSISGKVYFGYLTKMPHLLIAGATGSGKSVTIHAIITSLLFRNSPAHLRFIMIDPKRVELTLYKNIPHLLTPVITDPKKAILSLKWAAKEMDRRYDILETESVRDIASYHKNIYAPAQAGVRKEKAGGSESNEEDSSASVPEKMPYIVIVIDELADIMSLYPRELESAIVRLAQMSRAVGIHLVISTQRPSVNIITGLIKANIPTRIALQVVSQIDSRTILDSGGAEKLLGAGDMLYLSGEMSKPVRLQSAFMSEGEVKKVVKFLVSEYGDSIPNEIVLTDAKGKDVLFEATLEEDDNDDELYEEAREIVIHAGKASSSYLQRKLRVGYARAARLLDMLEERGVVGPAEGAKPREVLEEKPGGKES
ncbi:MAG: DNA translocase FtsK [Patescibacteria group bacterium]|nr:MAG: DNA translocase FtsK [Patescibacteria group bacterium]